MPLPLDLKGRPDERVLRQLVSALLYEGIVSARQQADDGATMFLWSLGGRDFRCRGSVGAFGRIRLAAGSVEMRDDQGTWIVPPLAQLVAALPGSGPTRGKLLDELAQTIAFCRWNERHLPERPRRAMSFAELEGALDEGHPYHPCFKARTGFSHADHAAFGPEVGHAFQLVWLLVARKHLLCEMANDEDAFWQAELADAWPGLMSARLELGASKEEFGLVPLHPWQWRELGDTLRSGWIAAGEAHYLGPVGDRYTATQSVRSLLNRDRPLAASLKLPLNIVNTSSRRTLEPHSVCTAPVISRWIAGIVASDPVFDERYPLTILKEYAGVIADRDGPLAGQVAAIWRESAEATLLAVEAVVPFNALMMVEADGRPFADDWISRFGLMPWINRLIEVAVLPVWHLLVHHGLAVEAHGQNMLLVHRDGWPVRLILRDFHESIEFSPGFLREPEKAPEFLALNPAYADAEPDQFYWTDNLDSLRELVMDTLFVFNLSEISHLLDHAYNMPEPLFWQRVAAVLASYEVAHGATERLVRLGCDQPHILTESLMTRKLLAAKPEYHHSVPNTLAADTLQRRRKS
ncbi:MAG TPA: IucA/IucC family protein [Ensifer sp.]|jgi:siderophore synthetase component|uniref:IucA/IucC family protein n=1 Tax=Ensifer sp. TaxID=1872086 RepID=UPI002E113B66|nr:IucA/IucC family protein [Ensifer sp.]